MQIVLSGRDRQRASLAVISLLLFTGCAIAFWFFSPVSERSGDRDARTAMMQSGVHLTLVVIAPTTVDDSSYVRGVRSALANAREIAASRRLIFSSIGVSDQWDLKTGIAMLAKLGDFDEIIVGRNWLNTGVVEYINQYAARPAVPQLIVTLQNIETDSTPHVYSRRTEVLRLVGGQEVVDWVKAGSPLQLAPREFRSEPDRSSP